MATIPLFQVGKNLISGVLVGQLVSTVGVLADSTSTATISAVYEGLAYDWTVENEEINALNTIRQNMVPLADGVNMNLSVLKVNNGTDPQPLRTLFQTYDYFKFTSVEGTGGSAKTSVGYYSRAGYNDGWSGRGKQIASLNLAPIDIGSAQVTIS